MRKKEIGNGWGRVGEEEVKRRMDGWVEGGMGDKRSVVQLNRCGTHEGRKHKLEFIVQRMYFDLFTSLLWWAAMPQLQAAR